MKSPPVTPLPLLPGDCLLYAPPPWSWTPWKVGGWLVGKAIAIKTWNAVTHCEAYSGQGTSVASRDGIGVGTYPLRLKGLVTILRPTEPFDLTKAHAWFATVDGQGYDWTGLLRFVMWGGRSTRDDQPSKQFCSEFLTRWYRRGGLPLFGSADADMIAPAQMLMNDILTPLWSAGP